MEKDENRIIEYKKIQEKYPAIARLAIAVKPPKYDYIGLYTTKIEKEKNKEKLDQWIQYWIETNSIQATIVISKLKEIQQDAKDEYKKEIIKAVMNKKENYFELMMVLLYLEEWDKLEIIVTYLIKINEKKKKFKKISENEKQEDIINISMIMAEITKKKKSIQRQILENKDLDVGKDYFKIELENNSDLKKEVITNFCNEIKENMECFEIENDAKKMQKNVLELEKILDGEKINITTCLIDLLKECMETIKKYDKKNLCEIAEKTKKKLIEISKEEIGELAEKISTDKMDLNRIVININRELLEVSNYELIFRFLKIFVDNKKYGLIVNEILKFCKVNKKNNKEVIKQITESFFKNKKIINCFDFLERIKVSNYIEYLPTGYFTIDECLEKILDKGAKYYYCLIYHRNLFIQKNLNKYKTKYECILEWMEIIETNIKTGLEVEKAEKISIIEMINTDGIQILEKDEIKEKLIEMKNRRKDKECLTILKRMARLLNEILIESSSISDKENKIRKLKYINSFAYDEIENYEYWTNINYRINKSIYNVNESIQLFKNLIENAETNETQSIIYIYMNTHLKAIYPIENMIKLLISKNMKNVLENIKKYKSEAILKKTGRAKIRYKVLFKCAYNINSTIVNLGDIKVDNNENICEVRIIGYKEVSNEFIYEIKLKNEIQDENKYEKFIKEQIMLLNNFELNNQKMKDKKNPYKYINNIETDIPVKYIEREKFIKEQIESKKFAINMLKQNENLKKEIIDKIEEIIKEESNSVQDIIDFYMNSFIKYIISINKFIKIARQYKKCDNIIEPFKKYKYYARYISKNDEISRMIMINQHSRIIYKGDKKNKYFVNGISLISFEISEYDEEKNILICTKFEISDTLIPSDEQMEIVNILRRYIDTKEFKILEELKNLKKMPELQRSNRKLALSRKYILYTYDYLMRRTLDLLLNDIPKMKLFLKLLSCNNMWLIEGYPIKEKKDRIIDIKRIFLKTIEKEPIIKDSIICYKRTYLNSIITLNDIFEHIFKINTQGRKLVNEDGIVNLEQFTINFKMNKKTYEDGEIKYFICKNTNEYEESMLQPVKMKLVNSENDNEISDVKAISYNVITGIINCEKI